MSRSCTRALCLRLLKHHPLPPLALLTALGKPREHLPASAIKPVIKPRQDPCTPSRSHPLARCLSDGLATLLGLGACTHPSVVLTPTVGQSLCLAGVASGSGMGSAFGYSSHSKYLVRCAGFWISVKDKWLKIF